jgi:hypothetical protein
MCEEIIQIRKILVGGLSPQMSHQARERGVRYSEPR